MGAGWLGRTTFALVVAVSACTASVAPNDDAPTDDDTVDTDVDTDGTGIVDTERVEDTALPLLATCDDVGAGVAFDSTPTWSDDVAPLVQQACVSCHAQDGVAPFALDDYDHARPWASAIRQVTHDRAMPPPGPSDCGECRTFRNAAWLSPEQIATFRAWADGGAPEGRPDLPRLVAPEPVALDRVDLELRPDAPFTPDLSLGDDHRCFVLDMGVASRSVVTGFQVLAGARDLVHHAIVFVTDPEGAAAAREADAADDLPGYPCYGSPGVEGATFVGGWVPGLPPVHYPDGTGIGIDPGAVVILQVHYVARAEPGPDQTTVQLQVEPRGPKRGVMLRFAYTQFELPPGRQQVTRHAHFDRMRPNGSGPLTLWGVGSHMHEAGRRLKVERILPDGTRACLSDVTHYDFDAQGLYLFDEPLVVDHEDDVEITCTWDTRRFDQPVRYGGGLDDEMCMAIVFATIGTPDAPESATP